MAIYRGPGGAGDATTDSTSQAIIAVEAAQNAQTSAAAALSSQNQAATSATNAANYATNASNSASSAATSATNAANSATSANTSKVAAQSAQTAAEAAKTAAETAENNAETAETNASASATLAQNWAIKTTGPVSGSEYSSKYNAQLAASSATAASNSATSASTSASAASTSATNAASSASAASTSAASASTSASTATTQASNAATSATAAAGSASTATTKASEAVTSASNAATSATNAANSATSAGTSATNAASSASSATASATTATNAANSATSSASDAADSASAAALSEANAATSASNASTSASSAATSASNAASSESSALSYKNQAATSASNAATSESNALSYKNDAATSATNAASSASSASTSASSAASAQIAAETARDQTLAAYDNFDDRYLGTKSVDPTVDNDGNPLVAGALYFSSTDEIMKVYTGSLWVAAYASLSGALLSANNLSDVLSVPTARTNLGLGSAALQSDTYFAKSGANSDVTSLSGITGGISTADYIDIDTAATSSTAVGRLQWDDGNGTAQLGLKGGNVSLQVGQEIIARVYNDSGSNLTDGQVVYISGAHGNRIAVKLAKADSETTSAGTLGIVTEPIASGAEGFITIMGTVNGLNTSGLTAGSLLYLSATTAGAYTATAPAAPNHRVTIGYVERVHAVAGSIYVKVDNGYELDELHNVVITSASSGDTLIYDTSAGVWKNNSLTAGSGISISNGAGSITVSNSGLLSLGATSPIASSGGANPTISLSSGYGDTQNPYGSKTANYFLAAPNGSAGSPSFRAIVAADIPTLNQNTTGTASNVTGIVAIANGGTGATTAAGALTNLGAQPASTAITTSNIGSQSVNYATSAGSASSATTATNQSGGTVNATAITTSGPIKRSSAGAGYLDGQYDGVESISTSGAIYSIGGGYVPGTTTLGNMYGIGYTYSGYAAGNPGGVPTNRWGMYVASGGSAGIFLEGAGRGWFSGDLYVNGGTQVVYNSGTWSINISGNAATATTATNWSGIPSGTLMLFQQTSAPTGWTKQTTHDNKALRVVSGTAGSGGSSGFTTVFSNQTPTITLSGWSVGSTTLSESQIPSHSHNLGGNWSSLYYRDSPYQPGLRQESASNSTYTTGGGGSHNHSISGSASSSAITLNVAYVDLIIASKN